MRLYLEKKYKKILLTTLLVALLIPLTKLYSQEEVINQIDASIRLAICGNEEIEWGEDCEPIFFEPFSCSLLGYEGGVVLCDSSCSYDFSECIIPDPPPPPVIDDEDDIDDVIEESVEKYVPKIRDIPTKYEYPFLEYFDLNGNGRIDENEFVVSVKLWGQYWKLYREESEDIDTLRCDLNKDGRCDIVDLSILLYHSR